jgi:prepilin-type N-terminal cleavage/methylation domain-containing protein
MQGLYGWFAKNLRGKKGQRGFTLIELLVVVTILGILAAIVTLSLVGLTSNATVTSCQQEYKTVQAALDAYMAYQNISTVPATFAGTGLGTAGTATSNMTTNTSGQNPGGHPGAAASAGPLDLFNPNPSPTNPNFTRNGTTQFYYNWDTSGKIVSIFDGHSNDMSAAGCKIT